MEEADRRTTLEEGALLDASVLSIGDQHVVVRLEGAGEGIVPLSDFREVGSTEPAVREGDRFRVYVEQLHRPDDRALVSKDKADRLAVVERVERAFRSGEPIEGEIVAEIEGGFAVDIGMKAFLPASQIGFRPLKDGDQALGQSLSFKVIKLHKSRMNVVLSRRAILEENRERAFVRLRPGAIVTGTVREVADFGAFVDVGGAEGLLHVSDLSWGRVKHPSEVVKVGDRVTVKVLRVDSKALKLSLGLRQAQDDPWLHAGAKYAVGPAWWGRS